MDAQLAPLLFKQMILGIGYGSSSSFDHACEMYKQMFAILGKAVILPNEAASTAGFDAGDILATFRNIIRYCPFPDSRVAFALSFIEKKFLLEKLPEILDILISRGFEAAQIKQLFDEILDWSCSSAKLGEGGRVVFDTLFDERQKMREEFREEILHNLKNFEKRITAEQMSALIKCFQ